MGSINSNVNSCPGEWVIEFKYVLLAYLPAVKGAGWTRGHLIPWRRWTVAVRWGPVDSRGISDAPEKRYGVESRRRVCHSGLLKLEFPGQHQPGGIVVKMVYAHSVYPVDIVGTSLFLINRLLLVAWSLYLCVSGRTGVLPLNHQVLLQRCSWGSASLWHHKVRPNSYDYHILFCSTILSSPVSGLNYKDYSCLIHCLFFYVWMFVIYLQKGHF